MAPSKLHTTPLAVFLDSRIMAVFCFQLEHQLTLESPSCHEFGFFKQCCIKYFFLYCVMLPLNKYYTIILAVDRRSCCQHWKSQIGQAHYQVRGRTYVPGSHRTVPRHCHVFKSGLFSIISESISSHICLFITQALKYIVFE